MSINLKRVRVEGLFKTFNLDVSLENNTLILVGENGSGKSTFINLVYYALTAQWDRLRKLPFDSCTFTIGDQDYLLEKDHLPQPRSESFIELGLIKSRFSTEDLKNLYEKLAEKDVEYWSSLSGEELRSFHINFSAFRPFPRSFLSNAIVDLARNNPLLNSEEVEDFGAEALTKILRSNNQEQFLFLPTYRRIEKELSAVFPDQDLDEALSSFRRKRERREQSSYIELVEFGMTDVDRAFESILSDLDRNFRSELNRLTGSYLRDIIRREYDSVDTSILATDEVAQTVDSMLSRIEDDTLPKNDREELRSLLADVKSNQTLPPEKKILAHFLTRLVAIHKTQQEKEEPVRKLAEVVNQYLSKKQLEFNPTAFELAIKRKNTVDNDKSVEVPLYGLSSGEKQIVSLFSHMFLSRNESYFLVIDEPELSISVKWQRRFLQDIQDTGKCSGLIAVTHSPFVFEDNSLSDYAHSISEFVRES